MAVISSAFGQVKLTDDDAKKFQNQVTYGKPKPSAHETVKQGSALFREFQANGKIRIAVAATPGK
jgi:hypothetical protein